MNDGQTCQCCGNPMSRDHYGGEADFCWTCGIYAGDPASECDTHPRASRPGAPLTIPMPGRDSTQEGSS